MIRAPWHRRLRPGPPGGPRTMRLGPRTMAEPTLGRKVLRPRERAQAGERQGSEVGGSVAKDDAPGIGSAVAAHPGGVAGDLADGASAALLLLGMDAARSFSH